MKAIFPMTTTAVVGLILGWGLLFMLPDKFLNTTSALINVGTASFFWIMVRFLADEVIRIRQEMMDDISNERRNDVKDVEEKIDALIRDLIRNKDK